MAQRESDTQHDDNPAMVDEFATVADDRAGAETTRRRSSGVARLSLFVALLCLLLVLGAGGAGGWYLWLDYQARPARAQALEALRAGLADKASRSELAQASQQPQRSIGQMQQALTQLQTANTTYTQRLAALEARIDRDQRGWTLSETLYLLRMADYRLRLAHDRNSAIAALEAADQSLQRLGEIDLLTVREAVAGEIVMLRRLPRPDPEGVALALGELQKEIGRLPLPGQLAQANASADDPTAAADQVTTAEADGALWSTLKKFVVVRRNNKEISRRPEPTRFAGARRRLHTALELARLAALRLDLQVYEDNLGTARKLLADEFDPTADVARAFIDQLSQQAARLHVGEAARIGKARRLLEEFMAADRSVATGNG